jgi:GTP-binding protein
MSGTNFVDYVKICCRSGAGGAGAVHLHRDKLTAKGGPDGGNGGHGGNIIIKGNAQLWTLLHLKYRKHVIADAGGPGGSGLKTGADGARCNIRSSYWNRGARCRIGRGTF